MADIPIPELDDNIWNASCFNITTIHSRQLASDFTRHVSTKQKNISATQFIRQKASSIWQFNPHTSDIISTAKIQKKQMYHLTIGGRVHISGGSVTHCTYPTHISRSVPIILDRISLIISTSSTLYVKQSNLTIIII